LFKQNKIMINLKEECLFLIHENRVLEAQSLAFQEFGSLTQAKEFIDKLLQESENKDKNTNQTYVSIPNFPLQEVLNLLGQGQKLVAVKLIKESTTLGLKESKDLADLLYENLGSEAILEQVLTPFLPFFEKKQEIIPQQASQNTEFGTKVSMDTILDLIRKGKKIEAVKLVKDTDGLGLKESKDIVEAIQAKYYKY
jgi:ribosomal protein L7/L12